jgi:hypothetical protein
MTHSYVHCYKKEKGVGVYRGNMGIIQPQSAEYSKQSIQRYYIMYDDLIQYRQKCSGIDSSTSSIFKLFNFLQDLKIAKHFPPISVADPDQIRDPCFSTPWIPDLVDYDYD